MDITALVGQLMALSGTGAFVAFLVNALKALRIVRDGDAPKWVTGANVVLLGALFATQVFAPRVDISRVDWLAGQLAQAGMIALGIFVQFGSSRLAHVAVRGFPLIGKSHSLPMLPPAGKSNIS